MARPARDVGLFRPEQWTNILGATFAKHEHTSILTIGPHTWDRWHLGRLGCPHPVAAASLHRVCQELRITSLNGLAKQIREIGNYKGIGTTAYALALAILGENGFDINAVHDAEITYVTIKAKARRTALKQKADRKRLRRAGPPSQTKDATL
jgi:hypothetical protein